ncbi:surfeit locus 1 family protein [Nitrosomonas sp. Nm51]|uniref:SURF1 family protein n=1 Tax=Nitrosomonas sp. Nm51 TaxID=133720 RepID=UPI0008B999E3|nr:SURF1 family protein [Nitrosomonas sp. Nm51]SEQ99212.1 surfeit locus 1 family protein [Nitrosomonas sp. Nm51]
MTFKGYQFKPKLWAWIVTAGLVVVFLELGKWQLSRAAERNERLAQLEQLSKEPVVNIPDSRIKLEDFLYRQVEVRGRYRSEFTIYLDNKTYKGRAGYHVLTPLQISNSKWHVMINRGWVPTEYDRSELPRVPVITGEVIITGTVVSPELKILELGEPDNSGIVWANFNLEHFQQQTNLAMQPIMIQQDDEVSNGLVRDWYKPESGASRNIGYAIQWFAFAITTIIIFLVLNVRRGNKKIQ